MAIISKLYLQDYNDTLYIELPNGITLCVEHDWEWEIKHYDTDEKLYHIHYVDDGRPEESIIADEDT
jgi:hypothetical protein